MKIQDKSKHKYESIEERLIQFSVDILNLTEDFPNTRAGNYFAGQMTRSGSAPALIYGEAQGAESRKDFIHKMQLSLKELRETRIALKLVIRKPLVAEKIAAPLLNENNELIAIFVQSIKTAQSRMREK